MKCEIPRLPDGELEVMQAIWKLDRESTRKEIETVLCESHPIAMTTLLTFLSRLSEKGFIETKKSGRTGTYRAIVGQHEYLAAQSSRFVNKICGGNISAFAFALSDSGLSKEDLEELSELLRGGKI